MIEILENNVDWFVLILFLIFGFGLIVYNSILIKKGKQTLTWVETRGQITKSEMVISKNHTKESVETYYRADIEYEYEMMGNKFNSNQAYLGDKLSLSYRDKADKMLKMFPINRSVSVFVNPDNYSESVLIKGSGGNRVLNIIVGLFLILAGILIKINFELIINTIKGLGE